MKLIFPLQGSFGASLRAVLVAVGVLALSLNSGVAAPWVTAHYPSYQQSTLPPDSIDLSAITHLIYFAALPQTNGSINTSELTAAGTLSTRVHNAGKKILLAVGGDGTYTGFSGAITPANRTTFVNALVSWVTDPAHPFDGIDLDMEPITAGDVTNYQDFVKALSAALTAAKPGAIIAGDFLSDQSAVVVPIKDYFAQINVMTYDLSGPYPDWCTWHDSPLYTDGRTFPNPNFGTLPSCDKILQEWIAAGLPAAKLGIGATSWGMRWTPATALQQPSAGMTMTRMTYREIDALRTAGNYRYDAGAQAPYLLTGNDFISFHDATLCTAKVNYVKAKGLGGLMIWDISAQYVNGQLPLLNAIKNAMLKTGPDFNSDGNVDLAIFNPSLLTSKIQFLRGSTYLSTATGVGIPTDWILAKAQDFNNDGKADLFLFRPSTGDISLWTMNGITPATYTRLLPLPAGWQIAAIADINSDGNQDLVLFNPSTRGQAIWFYKGTTLLLYGFATQSGVRTTIPADYTIAAATDFNGDGKPDLMLYNPKTRQTLVWYLNSSAVLSQAAGPTLNAGGALAGVADFNGDGKPDLLVLETPSRKMHIGFLNGLTVTGSANVVNASGAALVQPAGYNVVAP